MLKIGFGALAFMIIVFFVASACRNRQSDPNIPDIPPPLGIRVVHATIEWKAVPGALNYDIYKNGQRFAWTNDPEILHFDLRSNHLPYGTWNLQVRARGLNVRSELSEIVVLEWYPSEEY